MNDTTVKINSGAEVLAKLYNGELTSVKYANRTQAEKKVAQLGPGWEIYKGIGRPFYVQKKQDGGAA